MTMEYSDEELRALRAAMDVRHSVRTYDGRDLDEGQKSRLRQVMQRLAAADGGKWTMNLATGDGKVFVPSTYGVIKGARTFGLLGYDTSDPLSAFAAGYAMECVVLHAVAMGLGTCWVGGTFKETSFAEAIFLPERQSLSAVVAMGYDSGRTRLLERITKTVARSSSRRPFDSLFFAVSSSGLAAVAEDSIWHAPLEAVRIAPSAVNSQPWRAVTDVDTVHFYYRRVRPLSALDMGIALCHFDIARLAAGIDGRWLRQQPEMPQPDGAVYAASFSRTEI